MRDDGAVLNYEILMYLGVQHLQRLAIGGINRNLIVIQRNTMTEVKALHIRILVDIFLERRNRDDINIDDILPDWRKKHKTVSHNLEVAYKKKLEIGKSPKWYLNRYLAHPDKRRGDHFNWTPVIRRMEKPLKETFKTLPVDKLPALGHFQKYIFL
jgi:hypothetical protein